MPDPINAAAIPGANLRPDMVDIAATEMSGIGDKVGTQAATVVTTWQRLSAHYDAPEDTTLFGVMDPVKTHGETFDANIGKVSSALHTYAAEVEPIKAELAAIKADAENFLVSIAGGVEKTTYSRAGAIKSTVEWHEDQDTVDANNALIARVNDQMELLWAAERKCANAIYDIIGFPHIEAASESNPNGYGVEDIPEGTETPWGTAVERTESCGEKAVGAVKGFVWDGVIVGGIWGTVVGLGSLTLGYNPQTGEWFDGDTYGAAWSNLGMLAVGLATAGPITTPLIMGMPGPTGDFLRRGQETLLNAGKGLIAWDKWSEDPAAAAGEATFNIASIIIPVGAATAPVRTSASTAAAAIRTTARVLNYVDPAGLVVDGVARGARIALPQVGDAVRNLDFGTGGRGIEIDIPTVSRTDITVDTPRAEVDVDIPVRVPEDGVTVPVREPELVTVGGGNPGGGGTVTIGGSGDVPTGTGGGVTTGGAGGDVPTGSGGGDLPTGSGGAGTDLPGGTGGTGTDVPGTGGTGTDVPGTGGTPTTGGADNGTGGGTGNGTDPVGTGGNPTPWNPEMGDPTLSPADYGPDFVRDETVRGNPVDPNYGQDTGNGGRLDPNYAPPPLDRVPTEVRELVTDPDAPFGRADDGHAYTQSEWEARYLDANDRPIYPGNDGAVPSRRVDFSSTDEFTAHYGDVLDRMGSTRGDFMSFPGTPFEHRALPGSNLSSPYLTMRLTGDLPPNMRIEVSEIAPAFGQPGGGLQVRVIEVADNGDFVRALPVDELRRNGILDVVGDTSRMPAGTVIDDAPNTHYSDRWGGQDDGNGTGQPDPDPRGGTVDRGTDPTLGDRATDPTPDDRRADPTHETTDPTHDATDPGHDSQPGAGGTDADGTGAHDQTTDGSADADGPMTDEGARRRPLNRGDQPVQEAWAQEVYDEIVADPQAVSTIAENVGSVERASGTVGFTPEEIAQIRDHLMVEEHLLDDYAGGLELRRYDPSAQIAEAWLRLREGTFRDSDIVLLEHELAESIYMRDHPGASYPEAHAAANEQFNWYAVAEDDFGPGQSGAVDESDVLPIGPTVDDPVAAAGLLEEPTVGPEPGSDTRFLPPGKLVPPFVSLGMEAVKDGVDQVGQPSPATEPPLDWRKLLRGN